MTDIELITIDTIIQRLKVHNISEAKVNEILKSYEIASYIHKDQRRESGEPYINHPLNVANILIDKEVYDPYMICAALLHDTIEDATTRFTKEDIAKEINLTVSELVDGVTKISGMDYYGENYKEKLSKEKLIELKRQLSNANKRKLLSCLNTDFRVVSIKLADRLHNMRTLGSKKPEKQIENAQETMDIHVILAEILGTYEIKTELEALSLRYLDPENYFRIQRDINEIFTQRVDYYHDIISNIEKKLIDENINSRIVLRQKSPKAIYEQLQKGYTIENIYDLFYPKIMVGNVGDCFTTLGIIHSNYRPINGRFRDYINSPRTNYYQALHTTVSDSNNNSFKVKIKTEDMDKISAYGITAFWNLDSTYEQTQELLNKDNDFFKMLLQINETSRNDEEFNERVEEQLLTEHVYPYNANGKYVEISAGTTVLDYVCQIYPDSLKNMTGILVNGIEVPLDYPVKNNDQITLKTTGQITKDWESHVMNENYKPSITLSKYKEYK